MRNKLIQYLFLSAVIIAGVIYFYYNRDLLSALQGIKFKHGFLLFTAVIASFLSLGLNFKYVMQVFNLVLPFREYFGLTVSNTMFNYYLPARGGIVVRAYYLKRKYNFDFSKYISMMGGDYYINASVASISASILILINYLFNNEFLSELFFISLGISALLIFGYFFYKAFHKKIKFGFENKITKAIVSMVDGLSFYTKNPKKIGPIVFTQLIFILLNGARLFIAFKAIGLSIDFLSVLIVQSLVVFSLVFSITPGNIGIKEGIIGLLASMLGVGLPEAVLAATIDRVMAMMVTFLLGSFYTRILLRDVSN